MDALSRLAPAARGLLGRVDAALATLGAPADHPVWARLREVAATPADAVEHFAGLDLAAIGTAGDELRAAADGYAAHRLPVDVAWASTAGEAYSVRAAALARHLTDGGPDGLAGRLRATASYAEDVAEWGQRWRDELARTLAEVLTSAQAATLGAGEVSVLARVSGRVSDAAVRAAADIGAHVLGTVAAALAEGRICLDRWAPALAELPFRAPETSGPDRTDGTIRVLG
jgi:hypothetical protein